MSGRGGAKSASVKKEAKDAVAKCKKVVGKASPAGSNTAADAVHLSKEKAADTSSSKSALQVSDVIKEDF